MKATVAPASVVRGGTFALTVTVGPAGSVKAAPVPTGEVAVTFGGTVRVVPLAGGKAVVQLGTSGLAAGTYPVRIAYSGDPTYAPTAGQHQDLTVR